MEISGKSDALSARQRLQQRLHLQQDLFAPLLQALFAQIVLVDLIERQANEVFAVGAQRLGLVNSKPSVGQKPTNCTPSGAI